MKRIVSILILLVGWSVLAADRYVATTGNNATGDGTSGNPWQTIKKAYNAINAGDTLWIADGVYVETNLSINKTYTSPTVFASQSGNRSNVFIVGTTTPLSAYAMTVSCSNLICSNLTFVAGDPTSSGAVRLYLGSNDCFYGCIFTATNDVSNYNPAINMSGNPFVHLLLQDCIINQGAGTTNRSAGLILNAPTYEHHDIVLSNVTVNTVGAALSLDATGTNIFCYNCNFSSSLQYGINAVSGTTNLFCTGCNITGWPQAFRVMVTGVNIGFTNCNFWSTNNTCQFEKTTNLFFYGCSITSTGNFGIYQPTAVQCSNVVVESCTITSRQDAINIQQTLGVIVRNCTLTSDSTHGVGFGLDSVYTGATAGTCVGSIENCTIKSTSGHGLLIGANCSNFVAYGNNIWGGDHAVVVKENLACGVFRNTVYGGTTACLLAKGSTNTTFARNICYVNAANGACGLDAYKGDTNNKFDHCTATNNWFICGTNTAIYWTTDDGGGGVCDFNQYFFGTTVKFGSIRGGPQINTIEMLRTNWDGYSVSGNDSHSFYGGAASGFMPLTLNDPSMWWVGPMRGVPAPLITTNTGMIYGGGTEFMADDTQANQSLSEGRTFIANKGNERFRMGGYIYAAAVDSHLNGQGKVAFVVMRTNSASGGWDRISRYPASGVLGSLSGGSNYFAFSPPIQCREGDVFGAFLTNSGSLGVRTETGGLTYYSGGEATGTGWLFTNTISGGSVSIKAWVNSPVIAYGGDSIIAGHNAGVSWYPFLDSGILGTIGNSIPYVGSTNFFSLVSYCNYGKGSQTWDWVDETSMTYITNDHPPLLWLHCGVNDVSTGRAWADVVTNLNSIRLKYPQTNRLYFSEILPWTGGTDGQALTIRTFNTNYAVWCATNNVTLVRTHDAMGQTRSSTGQIDDLNAAYKAADNIHLSAAGVIAYVQLVSQALTNVVVQP